MTNCVECVLVFALNAACHHDYCLFSVFLDSPKVAFTHNIPVKESQYSLALRFWLSEIWSNQSINDVVENIP